MLLGTVQDCWVVAKTVCASGFRLDVGNMCTVPDKDKADCGTVDNAAALESDRERGNRGNAGSGATLASESLSELTKETSGVAVAGARAR
ncbi:hypothetical protein PC118_g3145 [Phytophthora cactorum]|uniref:Uncharacterized protein n=1 Tax=Phytophthora cactorum TaxID=29920 RepID=A0A329SW76_9STRA|nr:hypothetical protein PC118_g3145 [Phytophthora cactorum]KAG3021574.1 hypothetical protein PC120_g8592 [Phytophthora cactorum]KAG3082493.1 hypothetical protein PC121_g6071 [Phytophthora cactorum]KAG4056276.1 hypothetical protein PC123_g8658 [Phytophthora cactorum]RAW40236.1 hypothetical protein PC110_g3548 [Phytophthora cactorum]